MKFFTWVLIVICLVEGGMYVRSEQRLKNTREAYEFILGVHRQTEKFWEKKYIDQLSSDTVQRVESAQKK